MFKFAFLVTFSFLQSKIQISFSKRLSDLQLILYKPFVMFTDVIIFLSPSHLVSLSFYLHLFFLKAFFFSLSFFLISVFPFLSLSESVHFSQHSHFSLVICFCSFYFKLLWYCLHSLNHRNKPIKPSSLCGRRVLCSGKKVISFWRRSSQQPEESLSSF